VTTYLTDDWAAAAEAAFADLPSVPGATARLVHLIGGGPAKETRYHQVLTDGQVTELAMGDDPAADLSVAVAYKDVAAAADGFDVPVGFMQGRAKVVGSTGLLMQLLPVLESPEYRAALATLAAQTDY